MNAGWRALAGASLLLAACHGGGTTEVTPAAAHAPGEGSRPDGASTGERGPAEHPGRRGSPSASEPLPASAAAAAEPAGAEGAGAREAASRQSSPAAGAAVPLRTVAADQICATLGSVRRAAGSWVVDAPKLRATFAGSGGHGIDLSFRYLGPTAQTARLRSGRERRQLGLELSARDTCNLLYVMWRIEPASELVVSVKSNRAQRTHAECENRGYHRLRPRVSAPVPALTPGAEHRLQAEIVGGELSVRVDGALVWSGPLDADARELRGPSGLRSDNARFEILAVGADLEAPSASCGAGK